MKNENVNQLRAVQGLYRKALAKNRMYNLYFPRDFRFQIMIFFIVEDNELLLCYVLLLFTCKHKN